VAACSLASMAVCAAAGRPARGAACEIAWARSKPRNKKYTKYSYVAF
jgi:hypothetical protein